MIKYSETWPSIMAVMQLRVDQKGRAYSAIVNSQSNGSVAISAKQTNNCACPKIIVQSSSETFTLGDIKNATCRLCFSRAHEPDIISRSRKYRSESIKIDNWDYIYTERKPVAVSSNGSRQVFEKFYFMKNKFKSSFCTFLL